MMRFWDKIGKTCCVMRMGEGAVEQRSSRRRISVMFALFWLGNPLVAAGQCVNGIVTVAGLTALEDNGPAVAALLNAPGSVAGTGISGSGGDGGLAR